MTTEFDLLVMDADLKEGDFTRARTVWQEAVRSQTAGNALESVAKGADMLIDYACALQKGHFAFDVMDTQDALLPHGNNAHAKRIAQTGLDVMNAMLHPSWGKDVLAVTAWEKTTGILRHREKDVRDSFVQNAGNILIDYMMDKEDMRRAQKIRLEQEHILLEDDALSVQQFARSSKIMTAYYLEREDLGGLITEIRYQDKVMQQIGAPSTYLNLLRENTAFMRREREPTWFGLRKAYRHYADNDGAQAVSLSP